MVTLVSMSRASVKPPKPDHGEARQCKHPKSLESVMQLLLPEVCKTRRDNKGPRSEQRTDM